MDRDRPQYQDAEVLESFEESELLGEASGTPTDAVVGSVVILHSV